ncbi:MAG: bifunctional phosphoribosyl-AMP cyclohydrolase/phosphoribosyl-ATP diphosphatase HisIE [Gorillibacterium sp.]|nr:bifunctional phosphoribosyl-AMP cyclohydrolase/phosphoribosyl-ATP diphosphatase HisIE [Gorillibacterium sp.]
MDPAQNNGTESIVNQLSAIKWDEAGLVPAIVQDAASKEVLMLAYMNEESLRLTVETREGWFWSRSRQELWHKGATSGNVQRVRSIQYDCDADTLLVKVIPAGPACHNGTYTCFENTLLVDDSVSSVDIEALPKGATDADLAQSLVQAGNDRFRMLAVLESVIAKRDAERPEGAYTTYLFEKGIDKILKKVGEEAAEVIIAAKNGSADELRYEASDLIFHLLVLLREAKLPLDDLMDELNRRHNK